MISDRQHNPSSVICVYIYVGSVYVCCLPILEYGPLYVARFVEFSCTASHVQTHIYQWIHTFVQRVQAQFIVLLRYQTGP